MENLEKLPMTHWKTATGDDKLALVRGVNAQEPLTRFNPDQAIVQTLALPFYHTATLLRFDKGIPHDAPLWYVKLPTEIVPLDGSIANIHTLNAHAPIALSSETIAAYLKFRLYFGDSAWMDGAAITAHADGFRATARLIEKDGVYTATYDISPRGETSVLKKERGTGHGRSLPAFDF